MLNFPTSLAGIEVTAPAPGNAFSIRWRLRDGFFHLVQVLLTQRSGARRNRGLPSDQGIGLVVVETSPPRTPVQRVLGDVELFVALVLLFRDGLDVVVDAGD